MTWKKWQQFWRHQRISAIGVILLLIGAIAWPLFAGLQRYRVAEHTSRCAAYAQCKADAEEYRMRLALRGIHYETPKGKCLEIQDMDQPCQDPQPLPVNGAATLPEQPPADVNEDQNPDQNDDQGMTNGETR